MTSTFEAIGQPAIENLIEEPTASFVNNLKLKNGSCLRFIRIEVGFD